MDTKLIKQKILDLAIRGKLVSQNPADEPFCINVPSKTKINETQELFCLPHQWQWVPLSLIGDVLTGNTPSKDHNEYYGGEIPFYKPTDLDQGINTLQSSDKLTAEGYKVSRHFPELSILVTCIGATIGKTGLIKKEGSCNQQINGIIPFPYANSYFIYYAITSGYFQNLIKLNASATTLPILNKNNFAALSVPLPPLEEQKRIVAEIDRWFKWIDELDQNQQDLHTAIKQAKSKILDLAIHGKLVPQDANDEPASVLLNRIRAEKAQLIKEGKIKKEKPFPEIDEVPFEIPESWDWCRFNDIAQSNIGLTYKPVDVDIHGIPVLRSNNIQNSKLDLSDLVRVKSKILDNQFIKNGDLLICARNGSKNLVGKCALIDKVSEDCSFGAFMAVSRSIFNPWLFYVINSKYFRDYLDNSNSTTINQVTQSMLLSFLIPFPSETEQKRIVTKIEELFAQLDKIEESLN